MNPIRWLIFAVLFLVPVYVAIAQTPTIDWAKQAGSTSVDEGLGIATDAAGNSYVTGYFRGTATFGSAQVVSAGDDDIFIAKYTSAGRLVWARRAGSTGRDQGTAIALDNAGNLVITGLFVGTASFQTTTTTVTSAGGNDIVVAKFDTAGAFVWANRAGSAIIGSGIDFNEQGNAIITDNQNNIYVTGQFLGNATFSGSVSVQSSGGTDIFIAKYTPTGIADWAIRAGDPTLTTQNNDRAFGITIDPSNNLTITGDFENTISFGNNSLTSFGGRDIFVASFTNAGSDRWANRAGSTTNNDRADAIDSDGSGNVYATGFFQATATFEGKTPAPTLTAAGGQDIFISKYDQFGVLQWVIKGGSTGLDNARGISVDPGGNPLVTGSFEENLTFSGTTPTTASLSSNAGSLDVFVVKYNSAGVVQEALRAGGSTADFGYAIATDVNGRGYFTGSFTGSSAAFGATTLSTNTLAEIFIARFVPTTLLLPVELISFKATPDTDNVILTWQTASEKDNDYFTIERSENGHDFDALFEVDGGGNSTTITNYKALDVHPLPGTAYYRLRQTDFDGTFSFSPVVAVTFNPSGQESISAFYVFPNPSEGWVTVGFKTSHTDEIKLQLTDALGREVFTRTFTKQPESMELQLNLNHLPAGIYLVQLQTTTKVLTEKLVLK